MADDNKFGYGQLHPSDTASPYNVEKFIIDQAMAGMSTMKLVKISAVDKDAGTVDVVPMVKLVDGSGNVTDQGTIFGIPYAQMQWGTSAVKGTPAVGDKGMMVCADRDISSVKSSKDVASPGSNRKFSPADGVYVGGLRSLNKEPDQFIEFTDAGGTFSFKGGKKLEVDQTAGWTFTGIVTFKDNVQLGGSINGLTGGIYDKAITTSAAISTSAGISGGSVQAGSIDLAGHHHTAQGATNPTTAAQP